MEELRKLGFTVTGDLKVPADLVKDGVSKTAFRAEMQGKGPGPTVTIMLEYDALKNGHACGHNLIATSGLMAAAGLASIMKETPGRILVIGTPDERGVPWAAERWRSLKEAILTGRMSFDHSWF